MLSGWLRRPQKKTGSSSFKSMDTHRIDSNASMEIAPELGCNLFSWKVHGTEILYTPKEFLAKGDHILGGNPVLFPSVGRTWDTRSGVPKPDLYRIAGNPGEFTMPIHGLCDKGNWALGSKKEQPESITATYDFLIPESIRKMHYPFDVDLSLSFELTEFSIHIKTTAINRGDGPAPAAMGFHPYFSTPGRDGSIINLPSRKEVVLDPELLIPSGEKSRSDFDLSIEKGRNFDCAFSGLTGQKVILDSPGAPYTIDIGFDTNIEIFVIYSAADSSFICVEPWSAGLGAYSSLAEEHWDTGEQIPVIKSGASMTMDISYTVTPRGDKNDF
jgi:galactose mutarotase-like enzyme